MATGIVSTARLTHATPAATYAHSPNRNWESDADLPAAVAEGCRDIARQMVDARFGRGPRVILAGGRSGFMSIEQRDPEYTDKTGQRRDGRNLVDEWRQRHPGGAHVWNLQQFQAATDAPSLLGLFEPSHMQ